MCPPLPISTIGCLPFFTHDMTSHSIQHSTTTPPTHTPSQIHSLSVAEKEGDNPCRFAVGTGSVESWEQYYVLEAASAEKKEQWVQSIKEILKGQFELLKGESLFVLS